MHDSILKNLSIAFDLDGTLVDTAPDLVRVLNQVIAPDGIQAVAIDKARNLIGFGSLAMIQKAYDEAGKPLDPVHAKALQRRFFALYTDSLSQNSQVYGGVRETLAVLKRAGVHMSVCTNKPGIMARPLLAQLGLAKYFHKIVGSEDTKGRKPDAQHIFDAVGHRGRTPIIMVGDGAPDVYSARNAKVPVILMSYGYSPISVYTFGADAVLRNFRQLPSALNKILK